MAEERLLPNGDDGGWNVGGFADIDEGIGNEDAAVYASGTSGTPIVEGATTDIDFASVVDVTDGDTVTRVAFDIRAASDKVAASSDLTIQLLIGGTPQGIPVAVVLTGSQVDTLDVNDAGWNTDFTAAQLNGAQCRVLTTQTGMPTDDVWEIDVLDLVITYTPAAAGRIMSSLVGSGGLVGPGGMAGSGGGLVG